MVNLLLVCNNNGTLFLERTVSTVSIARILNSSQALAVYNAICEINNVAVTYEAGCGLSLSFYGLLPDSDGVGQQLKKIDVIELDGRLLVRCGGGLRASEREEFASQAAFAAAYGLNKG